MRYEALFEEGRERAAVGSFSSLQESKDGMLQLTLVPA